MTRRRSLVLLATVLAATALAADPTPEERARAAASGLAGELMARLSKELAAGGPAHAVGVCSEIAPRIAAERSVDGLTVRRVTARPRNPRNAPDAFEAARLERFAAAAREGKTLEDVVEWTGDGSARTLRYMRPIVIGKTCLACHGDRAGIDPAVRKILDERYPDDRATGYREGDLRGAISVGVVPKH